MGDRWKPKHRPRNRKSKASDASETLPDWKSSPAFQERKKRPFTKDKSQKDDIAECHDIVSSTQVHVSVPQLQIRAQHVDSPGLSVSASGVDYSAELFADHSAASDKIISKDRENTTRSFTRNGSNEGTDRGQSSYLELSSTANVYTANSFVLQTVTHKSDDRSASGALGDIQQWNLPGSVVQVYVSHGICQMFPWQVECLNVPGVLEGKNLVFSAPTSGGKTFISEILIIKKIIEHKRKALMVLPYVSVVREKIKYFQDLLHNEGIKVDGFVGQHSPPGGLASLDIAICTLEKANNIVNRLIHNSTLNDIGILIVDELHIIGEPGRGHLLELLLTKVLLFCKMKNINLQIIGMSATLPNLEQFAVWLDAVSYSSCYRPVPLKERIKVGHNIFEADTGVCVRDMSSINNFIKGDDDHAIFLTLETVLNGHSVLIFCPSKTWCENLALKISEIILKSAAHPLNHYWENLGPRLSSILNMNSLMNIMHRLQECPSGLDSVLSETISYGVAFHHAGLTFDERDVIEDAFRNGILKVLVATSTLAAGVNLPARRVIIRSPLFLGKLIDVRTYKQMAGRAGRKGIDSEGESILICKSNEAYYAQILQSQKLPYLRSQLDDQNKMQRAVLEVIACGVAETEEHLRRFIASTFLFSSKTKGHASSEDSDEISAVISKCLSDLIKNHFIFMRESTGGDCNRYFPTQLGQGALAAGMAPDLALKFCDELSIACKNFVLENDLHLLYEVIPPSISEQVDYFGYGQLANTYKRLSEDKKRFAQNLGIDESFIDYCISGQFVFQTGKSKKKNERLKRLFAALALQDLIDEKSLDTVSRDYGCSRGFLQSLQQSAAVFAGMLKEMCSHLKWHNLEILFDSLRPRIHFGVLPELCDLVRLSAVNGRIARILFDAGYINLTTIAKANPVELENLFRTSAAFNREQLGDPGLAEKLWIPGYFSITIASLVKVIVEEAQERVATDIGVKHIVWRQKASVSSMKTSDKHNTAITSSMRNLKLSCVEKRTQESTDLVTKVGQKGSDSIISYSSSKSSSQSFVFPKASTPKTKKHEKGKELSSSITSISNIEPNGGEMGGTSVHAWNSKTSAAHHCMKVEVPHVGQCKEAEASQKKLVISVCGIDDLEDFLKVLKKKDKFSLALACEKSLISEIGPKSESSAKEQMLIPSLHGIMPVGMAIYFGSYVYFISFCENTDKRGMNVNNTGVTEKLILLKQFLEEELNSCSLVICDITSQYHFLYRCCNIALPWNEKASYRDPCIAGWMLNRGGEKPSLHSLAKKYHSENDPVLQLKRFIDCPGSLALTVNLTLSGKERSVIEAIASFHLIDLLMISLSERNMLEHFLSIEMPCAVIISSRDCRGIGCDSKELKSYFTELSQSSTILLQQIYQMAGCEFDVHKSKSVGRVLFKKLKLNYRTVQAEEGNVSMRQKIQKPDLKILAKFHPLPAAIVAFRRLYYICFTVLKQIIQKTNYSSSLLMDRLHGHSNIFGEIGRISICDPPLQMIPADTVCDHDVMDDTSDIKIRTAFIPCEGHVLVSADYKQMELVIMAHMSQDPELIKEINLGVDIFMILATVLYKKSESEISKEERQQTKAMTYAMLYGMSQKRLCQEYDLDRKDVESLVQFFNQKFQVLMKFKEEYSLEAQRSGFIRTIGNREIPLPSKCINKPGQNLYYVGNIFNRLIQGSASDVFKKSIIKVTEEIGKSYPTGDLGAHLVLHIHDELLFEVKEEDVHNCTRIIKYALQSAADLSVDLTVSIKVGTSWGKMEKVE